MNSDSQDGPLEMSNIGFTADFSAMTKINPSQIAILQLAAVKGADTEHVSTEKELRFRPGDLKVIRYFQPR
jgi:hypothetical protein